MHALLSFVALLQVTAGAPAKPPAHAGGVRTPARVAGQPATPATPVGPPTVVVLVADDLGYQDLGVQGSPDIATPSIDRLFRDGVTFTNGYVSASLCSPSRAGLLTGRYQERFGHDFNPGEFADDSATFGLPPEVPTLAERLKARGYATALIGKWHLGTRADSRPNIRGFDEFYGFLGREHWYARNRFTTAYEPVLRGQSPVTDTTYLTRALAREASAFIERNAARPFFLYLPFNAVHVPMQADSLTLPRVQGVRAAKRRTYASMVTSLDDAVGTVLATLERLKLTNNTLVVFLSDNGGPSDRTTASNAPLSGAKAMLFEGGIRVPFAMRWPARLPAGATYRSPVIALDIAPTAVAAAGGAADAKVPFDGVDLTPFLTGQKGTAEPHARLFWRMGTRYAVREGNWKLVSDRLFGRSRLFDLTKDPGEHTSVEKSHRDVAKRLDAAYDEWNGSMQRAKVLLPGILGKFQQWYRYRKDD
ncbi:MAG: sulfatase-like hydrolase/transferase [Gemmatimonadaceae bacterium]